MANVSSKAIAMKATGRTKQWSMQEGTPRRDSWKMSSTTRRSSQSAKTHETPSALLLATSMVTLPLRAEVKEKS